MPKPKAYGSPLGTPGPSSDVGRPKARDPDIGQVRAALSKATTRMPTEAKNVEKPKRRSSGTTPRSGRPPALLDAEIEKQGR